MAAAVVPVLQTNVKNSGPVTWAQFHLVAFALSEMGSDSQRIRGGHFITNIADSVMCDACQRHCIANAEQFNLQAKVEAALKHRLPPENSESLFAVSVDFHNFVNSHIGKEPRPAVILLADAAREHRDKYTKQGCAACSGGGVSEHSAAAPSAEVVYEQQHSEQQEDFEQGRCKKHDSSSAAPGFYPTLCTLLAILCVALFAIILFTSPEAQPSSLSQQHSLTFRSHNSRHRGG